MTDAGGATAYTDAAEVLHHADFLRCKGKHRQARRVLLHHERFARQAVRGLSWGDASSADRKAAADFPWIARWLWPDMPELWDGQFDLQLEMRTMDRTGNHKAADKMRHDDRVKSSKALRPFIKRAAMPIASFALAAAAALVGYCGQERVVWFDSSGHAISAPAHSQRATMLLVFQKLDAKYPNPVR